MFQHPMYVTPLVISLAMAISTSTHAATRVSLNHMSFADLQQAVSLYLPNKPLKGAVLADSLRFMNQHTDKKNVTHIRMQQAYLGVPVIGGYAILHRAHANVSMSGAMYRGLRAELGQPRGDISDRGRIALQKFKANYLNQSLSEEHVTPVVYIDEQQRAFWAYKVSVLVQPRDSIPTRPTAIIDAETFEPFVAWNDVKTIVSKAEKSEPRPLGSVVVPLNSRGPVAPAPKTIRTSRSSVLGLGFGGNKRIGEYQFGQQLAALDITRDDYTAMCYLENKRVKVVDMGYSTTKTSLPMDFDCADESRVGTNSFWTGYQRDGYDLKNGAYSPSNDALYTGDLITKMYKEWYDFDVLTKGSQPMQLVMRVHFGKNYENAFWDGREMTFGDGNLITHPLVSLSVGAHEVSHGFTEQHSDLAYFGQSGGMNESFSDMAAQAAEYYAHHACSWKIGAEIVKEESGYKALRFMDKPSRDGRSIDDATHYRKGMDVHLSSGVYNRFFYLLSNRSGWNPRKAFHVMLKANMDYWTPTSTFSEGACGVIAATDDLEWSTDDVKRALDTVAVDYSECV